MFRGNPWSSLNLLHFAHLKMKCRWWCSFRGCHRRKQRSLSIQVHLLKCEYIVDINLFRKTTMMNSSDFAHRKSRCWCCRRWNRPTQILLGKSVMSILYSPRGVKNSGNMPKVSLFSVIFIIIWVNWQTIRYVSALYSAHPKNRKCYCLRQIQIRQIHLLLRKKKFEE